MNTQVQKPVTFELDGKEVTAAQGETIWEVAQREGTTIPHLCWKPSPGYRADGNCRACMVEVEGERVLAASCQRVAAPGMKVKTASDRASKAREMVFELLATDQPKQEESHNPLSTFWNFAEAMDISASRFPVRETPEADRTHPAIAVNLDACIQCNLCVRACREVQVNDVIGMAYRGHHAQIVFDMDDAMGMSTCVGCGECVQACPTGALMPSSQVDDENRFTGAPDKEVKSVCPYCGVGCQLTFKVKDNKIAAVDGVDGPANRNKLCVKGRYGFDYIHNDGRLATPLIRREGAPKDASLEGGPQDWFKHFRPATWEEALAKAAEGLINVRERDGGRAMAGFGSAKGTNEEAYLFQKLIRTGFGTNNVDHCTRLCHASSVAALIETIGSGAVTAPFYAAEDSEVIIVIGANPTVNHPVAATFIKQAAKNGAKLIVMDPRGQALQRYATEMVRFRPGSDVALLNAIMNVIIEEELTDPAYIETHTEGFEALKERVAVFTPEAMTGVCGISPEQIRRVARLYAESNASLIFWGMGVSQHTHGTDNARCLISLALMTGNVGKPGAGLHPLRGQNNVQGASDAGLIPMFFPDYKSVEAEEIRNRYNDFWGRPLDPVRGLTVVEIMDAVHRKDIKAMYIMGENPAMSDPDQQHVREGFARLEHLVVQEIFMTETAAFADVVLPASAFPEKDGTVTNTNRQVQIGRQAIQPPGEAKQDWEIIQDLAHRIGLDHWDYSHARDVFNEMTQVMASLSNITWERLEAESSVTYPCEAPDQPGKEIIFGDKFPTASGRGKFVATDVLPPNEVPDDEYPMILTTGRLLEHWHTGAMTRRASVLDRIEPEPHIHMNPVELSRLGMEPGETIRVSTRRGSILVQTRSDRDIPEGLLFMPFCYWEAAANYLTNPALDPFGKIPELKFSAVRVERLNKLPEGMAAE